MGDARRFFLMAEKLVPLSVSVCPETQIILFSVMRQRFSHFGTCRIGAQKRLFRDAEEPFPRHMTYVIKMSFCVSGCYIKLYAYV